MRCASSSDTGVDTGDVPRVDLTSGDDTMLLVRPFPLLDTGNDVGVVTGEAVAGDRQEPATRIAPRPDRTCGGEYTGAGLAKGSVVTARGWWW